MISFHYDVAVSLKNRNKLKKFLLKMAKEEGFTIDRIDYIFCSPKRILEINKAHLDHHYTTDIITFEYSDNRNRKTSSEIYICPDVVNKNAVQYTQTKTRELHRVIIHGLLHLCGYKDKSPRDQKQMRSKEDYYLERYFVPRGTK